MAGLSAARSAWSGAELTTATERALVRTGVVGDPQAVAELAEDVRARAEARCTSVLVGDEKVASVMSRHLTSAAVIDADMALNLGLAGLAANERPRDAGAGLAARAAGLDAGQADAVAAIAGAAGLEVVVGPAGTGKTAMLGAAREAVGPRGGPSWCWPPPARRPRWPGEELGTPATSVAKLLYDHGWRWDDLGRYARPVAVPGQPLPPSGRAFEGPGGRLGLPAGSVVVVDEAGLLSVDQAVALVDVVRRAGASLRLVGDPRQLGAVGRGGVMETAARWAAGGEVTLDEVHRFLALEAGADGLPVTVPDTGWAEVCEALREGADPAGAAEALMDRGAVFVHPSREEAVATIAAEAAREAGREGALAVTVATNADAAELNQAVRAARVAAGQVGDTVVAAGMDGARIGTGDRVVTRRNDTAAGVANREPWTVSAVNEDGSVVVRAKDRHVRLPAEYVASAVQLGYASTDYGNQGVTADRSVTWLGPATSSGGLYVGASRGRWGNTVHVVAEGPGEARDMLAAAVRRDRADRGLEAARARPRRRPSAPPRDANAPSLYRRAGAAPLSSQPRCAGSRPPWPRGWSGPPRCRSWTRPPGGPRPRPTGPPPTRGEPKWRGTSPRQPGPRPGEGRPWRRPKPSSSEPGKTPGRSRPAPGASGAGPSGCARPVNDCPRWRPAGGATTPSCPGTAGPMRPWPRQPRALSIPVSPISCAFVRLKRARRLMPPSRPRSTWPGATPAGPRPWPTTRRPRPSPSSWRPPAGRPRRGWSDSARP